MKTYCTIGVLLWTTLLPVTRAAAYPPSGRVRAIACAPERSEVAAVLIGRAVWVTEDRGRRWFKAADIPRTDPPPLWPGKNDPEPSSDGIFGGEAETDPVVFFPQEDPRAASDPVAVDPAATGAGVLAVGDRGTWAVALDGHLILGGPGPGIRRRLKQPGISGLFIAADGAVWVSARDTLWRYGGAFTGPLTVRRWHLPGAGAPVAARFGSRILVPSRAGLWVVDFSARDRASMSVNPGAPVEAAAASHDGGRIYAISRGRLEERGAKIRILGPVPGAATRLARNRDGVFYADLGQAGWFERTGDRWRSIKACALAVDADGWSWFGTDDGPVGPGIDKHPAPDRTLDYGSLHKLMQATDDYTRFDPGPHKCRSWPINPLPAASAFAGFGRGSTGRSGNGSVDDAVVHRTGFHVGLSFTWRFDPLSPWRCLGDRERWHALAARRREEVEGLYGLLVHVRSARVERGDLLELADRELTAAKLTELIRIKSGVTLAKEER